MHFPRLRRPFRPPEEKPSRPHAFTVAELLAVIAIMVVLMTFTLPILRGGSGVEKAAWEIAGLIEQARAAAMAQSTYVWVGFNETQVSTADQKNTAVFIVVSKDGSSTFSTANLLQIGKTSLFNNLKLADFSGSQFDYGNRDRGAVVTQLAATTPLSFAGATAFPGKLSTYTSCRVLRIDPDGSARIPDGTAISSVQMVRRLELGLQPMKGAAVPPNNSDTAAIQVAGLTAQARIYRP